MCDHSPEWSHFWLIKQKKMNTLRTADIDVNPEDPTKVAKVEKVLQKYGLEDGPGGFETQEEVAWLKLRSELEDLGYQTSFTEGQVEDEELGESYWSEELSVS